MEVELEYGAGTNDRSKFYPIEPTPLAVDLDGDGIEELVVPQNLVKEGLLAVVFKGPAGFRLQSVNTGFEGGITALGRLPDGGHYPADPHRRRRALQQHPEDLRRDAAHHDRAAGVIELPVTAALGRIARGSPDAAHQGRARRARHPARRGSTLAAGRGGCAPDLRSVRLREIRRPPLRAHRAVRARDRRRDGHRQEGDVHLRGQGRRVADAAPGGDRRRCCAPTSSTASTSSRSRSGSTPWGRCSATSARRRVATGNSTRSTSRPSARSTRRSTPRSSAMLIDFFGALGLGGPARRCTSTRSATRGRGRPTSSRLVDYLTPLGGSSARECQERLDAQPAARARLQGAGLPARHRQGAVDPRLALARRAEHFEQRAAISTPWGGATRSIRGSSAASTTTCARPSRSRPRTSARRTPSRAADATTGSSSSSAGRRIPGSGSPSAWSASVLLPGR